MHIMRTSARAGFAQYLARADECEREAKKACHAEIREQLQQIAEQWRELAAMAPRNQ